jgi:hypothetical protein
MWGARRVRKVLVLHRLTSEPAVGIEPTTAPVAKALVQNGDSRTGRFGSSGLENRPLRCPKSGKTPSETQQNGNGASPPASMSGRRRRPSLLRRLMRDRLVGVASDEIGRVEDVADQLISGARDARQFLVEALKLAPREVALSRWAGLTCTYFIRMEVASGRGPIKIGQSCDPIDRLNTLRVGSPYQLTLIGCAPGVFVDESVLHSMFSAHRMRGEWFAPRSAIRALAAEVAGFEATQDARFPWQRPRTEQDLTPLREALKATVTT